MLKRASILLVASLLAAASLLLGAAGASASSQTICDPRTGVCYVVVSAPATDPGGKPDPTTGLSAGPTQCTAPYAELDAFGSPTGTTLWKVIPCSSDLGWWSNSKNCYVSLAGTADTTSQLAGNPEYKDAYAAGQGAWYACRPPANCAAWAAPSMNCWQYFFWSTTPPPGVNQLTPGQAAAVLVKQFQVHGVNIGLVPDPNIPGARSYVGVPIWMWVANPTQDTYGPWTISATLGGQTISATAKVGSILWNMGDGHTVACGSAGTAYNTGYGVTDSPTCGYRYTTTSAGQAGGRYTITATSQWQVTWTGGGQTGSIPLTTTSTSSALIGELQSVNVKP